MLHVEQFARIGKDGVGNERSKNAQSMAYFKGYLYLGVTHHNGEGPMDCARILRYRPKDGIWEEVYKSPLVQKDERAKASHVYAIGRTGQNEADRENDQAPLYRGYRGMSVFKGRSDKKPALYVGTISHWGAQILRSEDGVNFQAVSEPGLGNPDILSIRNLVEFNGRLFATHAGSISGDTLDRNFSETTTIYVSDDPASGEWREAMEACFGDDSNSAIFGMIVFNNHLYAGTGNPERGFQVWRTAADGEAPFVWEQVLKDGAYRYNLNEVAISMAVFRDALYIGTGIPGLGYDKTHDVGPAAAELVRLNSDDSWDIVVGSPRFTPDGLKIPVSAMGPGFDDFDNTVFWSMGVHNGSLYLGTNNVTPWKLAMRGADKMKGGSQFWATDDGENWEAVTMDGFGNHFAIGIRTMVSAPEGFFVGTSNHQEVEKLWYKRARRSGEPGIGGLEVWLGNSQE